MFCSKCGKPINPGAAFCSSCGTQVSAQPHALQPVTEAASVAAPASSGDISWGMVAANVVGMLGFCGQQGFHAVHFKGYVLNPRRRVFVSAHFGRIGQFKKCQHIAAAGIQEDVHVRIGRFGGWHHVFGNGQDKVHIQVFGVPLDGFFSVFAAVGGVVNSANFHDFPLGVYLNGTTSNLIAFQGLK